MIIQNDAWIYLTLVPLARSDSRSISKQNKADLNIEFSIYVTDCRPLVKEPSRPYYLLAGAKTEGFLLFRRAIALNETQDLNSRN